MSATETIPEAVAAAQASGRVRIRPPWITWVALGLFAALWVDLIRLLGTQWETREQYAYGWFVPLLSFGLFIRLWPTRPRPSGPSPLASGLQLLLSAFCFLVLLSLLPLRVIYEINTDWPLIAWLYAGTTVAISLYAVYLAGGTPWVRHFAFPICFILVAVVWPNRVEKGLTQGLMRVVAAITVELLGWFDVPAMQQGNLIQLSTGTVGIDEACSGIRSLQSTIMAALFLGELYLFRWPLRLGFLVAGVTLAFILNVARAFFLSYEASAGGLQAIHKWHDPAGFSIVIICFICLWGLAWGFRRFRLPGAAASAGLECSPAAAPAQLCTRSEARRLRAPVFCGIVGVWSVLCVGAMEVWYRSHQVPESGVFHWSLRLPTNNPSFENLELPPLTVKNLRFDSGIGGKWVEDDRAQWTAYFFRWHPKNIESVTLARLHRPEVCLPASGLRQIGDSEPVAVPAGGYTLPFRKYVFEAGGVTMHVFFCQWADGPVAQPGMQSSKQADRLEAALVGRRFIGQQTLEIILTGYEDMSAAEAALRRHLPQLIQPDPVSTLVGRSRS